MEGDASMLVLGRRPGEEVEIEFEGTRIRVGVQRVMGRQVRLTFLAPRSVVILRRELREEVNAESANGLERACAIADAIGFMQRDGRVRVVHRATREPVLSLNADALSANGLRSVRQRHRDGIVISASTARRIGLRCAGC